MQQTVGAAPNDRFVIYLNDHRGLLAAESDLAQRAYASNQDGGTGGDLVAFLASIVAQSTDDRERIDALLAEWGGRPNPLKTLTARIGERLGRLKLNGQLRGYSPLSRVVELEALIASTGVRRSMWKAIAMVATAPKIAEDAQRRAGTVHDHHERLTEYHLDATFTAFRPSR